MKRILIILMAAFIISSCSLIPNIEISDNPGSTDNPGATNPDTPSTDPSTPSTPSTNIPSIPGAPDINTDQTYVAEYISSTKGFDEPMAGGPTGIAVDMMSLYMEVFETLVNIWYEQHGEILVGGETIETHDETLSLSSNLSCHFTSGMNTSNRPQMNTDFTLNRYTTTNGMDTFTIWGSIYSEVSPNAEWMTTCGNSDISLIVDRNGLRFSFVSTDFTMDSEKFYGTAYINGNLCYFSLNIPDSTTEVAPVYPPITVPDPVV